MIFVSSLARGNIESLRRDFYVGQLGIARVGDKGPLVEVQFHDFLEGASNKCAFKGEASDNWTLEIPMTIGLWVPMTIGF